MVPSDAPDEANPLALLMRQYNPELYWNQVAREIERGGSPVLAGDDDPYYRYKRRKFVRRFLDTLDLRGKSVLEVGFGPGGNLHAIAGRGGCRQIIGVDIAQTMCDLARRNLGNAAESVTLLRTDGEELPFRDRAIDTVFTVTVLQHSTHEAPLRRLVSEICRVARHEVVIIEDIGEDTALYGDVAVIGRPVDAYRSLFGDAGFALSDVAFLNTRVSRAWHHLSVRVRRRMVGKPRHEGERAGFWFRSIVGAPLVVTRRLDDAFAERADLARMIFRRA